MTLRDELIAENLKLKEAVRILSGLSESEEEYKGYKGHDVTADDLKNYLGGSHVSDHKKTPHGFKATVHNHDWHGEGSPKETDISLHHGQLTHTNHGHPNDDDHDDHDDWDESSPDHETHHDGEGGTKILKDKKDLHHAYLGKNTLNWSPH